MLEAHFLKDIYIYIASLLLGTRYPLQICRLFTQFWMMHMDPTVGYPRIAQWMKDVQETLSPTFDEVHVIVYTIRDSNKLKGTIK